MYTILPGHHKTQEAGLRAHFTGDRGRGAARRGEGGQRRTNHTQQRHARETTTITLVLFNAFIWSLVRCDENTKLCLGNNEYHTELKAHLLQLN